VFDLSTSIWPIESGVVASEVTWWLDLYTAEDKQVSAEVPEKEDSKAAFIIGDESDSSSSSENDDETPRAARLVETVSVETQTSEGEPQNETPVVTRTLDECVATLRSEVCLLNQNFLTLKVISVTCSPKCQSCRIIWNFNNN